jgi:hypothetical protein
VLVIGEEGLWLSKEEEPGSFGKLHGRCSWGIEYSALFTRAYFTSVYHSGGGFKEGASRLVGVDKSYGKSFLALRGHLIFFF